MDFPNVPFSMWANFQTEFIEFGTRDRNLAQEIVERLRAGFTTDYARFRPANDGDGFTGLVLKYRKYPKTSIPVLLDRSSVVLLYPIEFNAGWESYRGIVLDDDRLPGLFTQLKKLGEVTVVQKKVVNSSTALSSMLFSWEELFSEATARQKWALLRAVESGYYEVPRRVDVGDLVQGTDVARTTMGEHIQKAEGKLMRAIAPFLSLDVHGGNTSEICPLLETRQVSPRARRRAADTGS
jgi:predicted DNA binding protein